MAFSALPEPFNSPLTTLFVFLGVLLLVALVLITAALRVVPAQQRLVVFRLGRLLGVRGPGLVVLLPLFERGLAVDLRTRRHELKRAAAITRDRARVMVDLTWTDRVVDPLASVMQVEDAERAVAQTLLSALTAILAGMSTNDVMGGLESVRSELQERVRARVAAWGIELGELKPIVRERRPRRARSWRRARAANRTRSAPASGRRPRTCTRRWSRG